MSYAASLWWVTFSVMIFRHNVSIKYKEQSLLTVIIHKGEDHRPRVGHNFTWIHFSASVFALGEVDLQLVQQALRVHLGQVGDQYALRTHLRRYLQDGQEQITHRRRILILIWLKEREKLQIWLCLSRCTSTTLGIINSTGLASTVILQSCPRSTWCSGMPRIFLATDNRGKTEWSALPVEQYSPFGSFTTA